MLYKYKASTNFWSIPQCGNKIQNFVGWNNQFEKCFRQNLEKCFIDIKILARFTKPSVAMTLYRKSTKMYLILVHFVFLDVHIDGSNKYGWIEEVNKFLQQNFNIFPFLKRCFCVRFCIKFFYKKEVVVLSCFKESPKFLLSVELFQRLEKLRKSKWSQFLISDTKINWNTEVRQTSASEQVARMHQICLCTKQLSFSKKLVPLLNENDIYINQIFNIENVFTDIS